jgi:hypothetical protein
MRLLPSWFDPDVPAAMAWIGESGEAICVFADRDAETIDWLERDGSSWEEREDFQLSPDKGETESVVLRPAGTQHVIAAISDDSGQIWVATYDGAAGQWARASCPQPLTASLAHTDSVPFDLAIMP